MHAKNAHGFKGEERTVQSIDVANYMIDKWGDQIVLTNLKLNKLVYFSQVDALRDNGEPLFGDEIQAWQYGPVEPKVYHSFNMFGKNRIASGTAHPHVDQRDARVIDGVMETLGNLAAFDLVALSHDPEGAWASVYVPDCHKTIGIEDILNSGDFRRGRNGFTTFSQAAASAIGAMPNAMRLLENS